MAAEQRPSVPGAPGPGGQKFGATPAADSAGLPWAGRSFDETPNEFVHDRGLIDPALAGALAAFRAGEGGQAEVVAAFVRSRVLIPLLAEAGEIGYTPEGKKVDKTQELSIVTVAAPDGRTVMPVFSSVAAMQRWDPTARPVPSYGNRVALAAIDDGNDLVILDPTSADTEFGLRRPALWAIAQERPYLPAAQDPEVVAALSRARGADPRVAALRVLAGDPLARLVAPELVVEIVAAPGLSEADLAEVLAAMQETWAREEAIADRVDSLTVRFRAV